ncbi:hypothetical protein PMIN06_011965 [Paraphaeosphaeria minitans]|uniref:Protein kinase domain-containing protein n=1 Tax=Paraphaeosphaeria minitans TaxID=565426 RepID=A0A9P6GET5_9PLEO|nr:hypothetical protein PMIN01_08068 [Paraphaeosphaeria minitans]
MTIDSSGQPPLPHALPRPQQVFNPKQNVVPTKLALEAKARRYAESVQPMRPAPKPPVRSLHAVAAVSRSLVARASTPLGSIKTLPRSDMSPSTVEPVDNLGTFTQDGEDWDVRAPRGRNGLLMVKTRVLAAGLAEKQIFDLVDHENVVKLLSAVSNAESIELFFEYSRFTLAQIFYVHLKMGERHIQCIAHAIFSALSHLAHHGMIHHRVQAKAIRFTTPDLRIVLCDFEAVTQSAETHLDNTDLRALGFVLLECMEGHALPIERHSMDFIVDQRAGNRVFGLTNAEQWSGCKDMVDFLDELFNDKKIASAKYAKPHTFVSSNRHDYECMRPYIELVTLECFTPWTSAD